MHLRSIRSESYLFLTTSIIVIVFASAVNIKGATATSGFRNIKMGAKPKSAAHGSRSDRSGIRVSVSNVRISGGGATLAPQSIAGCGQCGPTPGLKRRATKTRTASAVKVPCHPKGYVDPKISKEYTSALRDMRRAGLKPQVTSAWRSSDYQAQLHNCSTNARCRRANPGLYYAMPPGQSLHEAGFAVDISGVAAGPRGAKRLTPKGRKIVSIMRKNGFSWRYGLSDPAHFEASPQKHGYRSVKAAIHRNQTRCQVKLASNAKASNSSVSKANNRVRGTAPYLIKPVVNKRSSARAETRIRG